LATNPTVLREAHMWLYSRRRFCVILLTLLCLSRCASAQEVNLLAMGDWGSGDDQQKVVAGTISEFVRDSHMPFDGMLLAGDNFYVSLSGVDDPQWQTLFEKMYATDWLSFPFYVAVGNHDLEGNKLSVELGYARAHPQSRWKLPSRWYRVDFPNVEHPLVTALMLDSNRNDLGDARWRDELTWMTQQLDDRRARWVVCCAHHPLFSNGNHGDNGVLQRDWGPLFKKYDVDFFICGHDHDLQHLEMPGYGTSFLLVGGGGKQLRPIRVDQRGPFSKSLHGFAHLRFTADQAVVRYVDSAGKTVHLFQRDPQGHVKVIDSTKSDLATPRTVRSISRDDEDAVPSTRPATAPMTRSSS
jgi:tartrate-resistant acid phosphatase type 5